MPPVPSPHLKSSSQPVPAPRVRALWPLACSSGASAPSTTAFARSSGPTSAAEVALSSYLTCFRGFLQALGSATMAVDPPGLPPPCPWPSALPPQLHLCLRGLQTPMTLRWSFTCLYGLPWSPCSPTDFVPSCGPHVDLTWTSRGPPQPSAASPLRRSLVYLYPGVFLPLFVHCQDLSPSLSLKISQLSDFSFVHFDLCFGHS